MASLLGRILRRGADDAAGAASSAGQQTARQSFARGAGEALGGTPGRVGEAAVRVPERAITGAAEQGTRTARYIGGGVGAAGVGGGAAYAYGQRQDRIETEETIEERNQQRETLNDILDSENLPEGAREGALNRALESGLFDPDLGGDPDDPDNIFENVWFRRVLALMVAYYVLSTLQSRAG